ncbi:hypothetical protein QEN19_002035 [Hanseniaspora menglaensis]
MGRPLSVQELLILKSKKKDIQLVNKDKPIQSKSSVEHLLSAKDHKKDKVASYRGSPNGDDSLEDLYLLEETVQTSKRVDKLTKIPPRMARDSHNGLATPSFSQLLLKKSKKDMTVADWEIYAKLNKVTINTMSLNKNYTPVRSTDELGLAPLKPVFLDSFAQYSINYLIYLNRSADSVKPFLGIDNASSKKYSISAYAIPIIYALLNDKDIQRPFKTSKLAPVAIIVTIEDKVQEIQEKFHALDLLFPGIQLNSVVHVTTLQKLISAIEKNQIDYYRSLRFLVADFFLLDTQNKLDEVYLKIKKKNLIRVVIVRKSYQLHEIHDSEFSEALNNFLANVVAGEGFASKGTFSWMNILELR